MKAEFFTPRQQDGWRCYFALVRHSRTFLSIEGGPTAMKLWDFSCCRHGLRVALGKARVYAQWLPERTTPSQGE